MKWEQYVQLAVRTESTFEESMYRRVKHSVIGICTEVAELAAWVPGDSINLLEEIGDVLWYVAIQDHATARRRLHSEDQWFLKAEGATPVLPKSQCVIPMVIHAGNALNVFKRIEFYRAEFGSKQLVVVWEETDRIVDYLIKLARHAGITIQQCMERNIAKLQKRFPEKFTTQAALNRDLQAEATALSGG